MFHRVKSENSYDTQDQETQTQDQAQDTQASKAASLREQAQQTAADMTKQVQVEIEEDDAEEEAVQEAAPAQNLYQRTATAASIRPASQQYATRPAAAPSYSAPMQAAAAAPQAPSQSQSHAQDQYDVDQGDRRLAIGRGITMSGEIEHCDYLLVEGTVEAALKGATHLEIAESGVFYGTVEIENAVIAGRFEGEIIVHGSLTVESTGIITGSLSYKELAVESGAVIDGRITPLGAVQSSGQARPAQKRKAVKSKPANEGLFATEAAE